MFRRCYSILFLVFLLGVTPRLNSQEVSASGADPQLEARIKEAKSMIIAGDFFSARSLLEETVAQNPESGEAYFYLGLATLGGEKSKSWKKKEKYKASDYFLEAARAGYHLPFGGWEKDYPIRQRDFIEANWRVAEKFIQDKDPQNFEPAIHLLENIVSVNHKEHDASEHLGRLYVKTGQSRKALDLFQRLLEAYPDKSESIYDLGLGFFDIYNKEIAQAVLADLSNEGPEKMTALMKLLMARAFFVLEDNRIASVYYFQCLDDLNEIAAREMYRDIMDIVRPKERKEYKSLRTIEQKKRFFRKFWKSRDPSPTTEYNERLVEHYRRLNYAKQHFFIPQTKGYDDRGIIYIKHGEPDQKAFLPGNWGIRDNETWLYRRKPNDYIYHFVKKTTAYYIATSLAEAVVDNPFTVSYGEKVNPEAESPEEMNELVSADDLNTNFRELLLSRIEIDPLYMRLYAQRADFNDPDYLYRETITNFQMDEAKLLEPALTEGFEGETYIPDMGTEPLDYYYYTADFMAVNSNSNVNIFYGLPVSALEFKRDILGVRVNYESTFAVFDQEWQEVKRVYNRRSYQLRQEPDKQNKGLLMVDIQTLNLPPGDYHYSVSVRDLGSNHLGIYKGDLKVTPYKMNEFNVSQIVLASNITPFEGNKPTKFTRGKYNVMPMPSRTFRQDQAVFVYYEVYFLTPDEDGKKHYNVDFTIEAEKLDRNLASKVFASFGRLLRRSEEKGKITLTFDKEGDPDRIAQPEFISIDISDSPPGRYNLEIVVTDMVSGKKVTRENKFWITKPE